MPPLGMRVSPPSFVQPRQRCTAHQTQQKVEGGIKAALQLFKRARVNLTGRPAYYAAQQRSCCYRRQRGQLPRP